jgi:putative FmdB family regulatory protein
MTADAIFQKLKMRLVMPIFEYICLSCGNEFEKLVPGNQVAVQCERCDSEQVEKKFSIFAAKVNASCGMKSNCPSADSAHCCSGGCPHH